MMMAVSDAMAAGKRKRVDEEDPIQDGNREKRMKRLLEDNPAGDSQQSTPSIVKRKRGRPSSSSTNSNNSSIRIINWQLLPSKSSNEESTSLSDKKIRKPLYLITDDKPNDFTIPTTDVAFAQKFMSITPFKFRGRKPGVSFRSANNPETTSTDARDTD